MELTLGTIPDDKLTEAKALFIEAVPIPLDDDGNERYTAAEWVIEWGREQYWTQLKKGARRIASRSAVVDTGLLIP